MAVVKCRACWRVSTTGACVDGRLRELGWWVAEGNAARVVRRVSGHGEAKVRVKGAARRRLGMGGRIVWRIKDEDGGGDDDEEDDGGGGKKEGKGREGGKGWG